MNNRAKSYGLIIKVGGLMIEFYSELHWYSDFNQRLPMFYWLGVIITKIRFQHSLNAIIKNFGFLALTNE